MKYKLINEINPNYSAIEQILTNRGIPLNNIHHYLNTTDKDINNAEMLGKESLDAAVTSLIKTIQNNLKAVVIVDCDCDGYTSAAILINYLHDLFPSWVENNLDWYLHEDKTHGLSDCVEFIEDNNFDLIFCPDSSSNDYQYHSYLKNQDKEIIILDHHEADHKPTDAICLNNQLSDYPNKDFSGAGIVWQFCRYLDKKLNKNLADEYLDLMALGNCGDMMSLQSLETKHLILKGFKNDNIKNPFIYGMADKNSYSLGSHITPMGAAFYIVPFINAMVRSGTLDEKELTFKSLLKHEAFKEIPSNKRGHKLGEMERVVDQALRTVTNVKNRQTREQDHGMEMLESLIEKNNMMEHKVLFFMLESGQIDTNIGGLIANKLMAKYQRPVCVCTKVKDNEDIYYRGSARGYSKSGVESFRQVCLDTELVEYAEGHANAFGISIKEEYVEKFLAETDTALANMETEPLYYVDYIFKGVDVSPEKILDVASLNDLWGQGMEEAFVCIENLKVAKENLTLMSPDKKPTLKITLPNKISLIKFGSSQEEYEKLLTEGYIELNIVGRCNENEWNGNITPQILVEDYEIIGQSKYNF